jgi:hypothetical protein
MYEILSSELKASQRLGELFGLIAYKPGSGISLISKQKQACR